MTPDDYTLRVMEVSNAATPSCGRRGLALARPALDLAQQQRQARAQDGLGKGHVSRKPMTSRSSGPDRSARLLGAQQQVVAHDLEDAFRDVTKGSLDKGGEPWLVSHLAAGLARGGARDGRA